jgi:ABC-type branched-subunit amino acid transport system substrate-binding protein
MSARRRAGQGLSVCLIVASLVVAVAPTNATAQVRGFDGSTITVAGIGIKGQLPLAETGARARIKRFNDDNEVKGIEIEFAEFVNDNQDPATSLSELRRLVTQVGIFALVADISLTNPADYLEQEKVLNFGGGFDDSYCSPKVTTKLWAFGVGGCFTPSDPSFVSDSFKTFYEYTSKQSGKKRPTLMITAPDNTSGKASSQVYAVAAQGAGFKVVSVETKLPPEGASDYTPYAQDVLNADDGKAPDATFCLAGPFCLGLYALVQANDYQGVFSHGLYTDALVEPLAGSTTNFNAENFSSNTAGMKEFKADMDAVEPGSSAKVDIGALFGYGSTDMFIQALKKVAAKGKSNITPENVQKVASTMTWEWKGVMGPLEYPKSTVMQFPACYSQMVSNGTAWETVVPYECSRRTFSPDTKIG